MLIFFHFKSFPVWCGSFSLADQEGRRRFARCAGGGSSWGTQTQIIESKYSQNELIFSKYARTACIVQQFKLFPVCTIPNKK